MRLVIACTCARLPTETVMVSETSGASLTGWITWRLLASIWCGSRLSTPHPWRISATTWQIIVRSTRPSAISQSSIRSLRQPTIEPSRSSSISWRTTPAQNTPGFERLEATGRASIGITTSGLIRDRVARCQTTGSATSVVQPGRSTKRAASTTCTCSWPNNRTSTGATRRCTSSSIASYDSGSSVEWTGSESMSHRAW